MANVRFKYYDIFETIIKDYDILETILKDYDTFETILKDYDIFETILKDYDIFETILKDYDIFETILRFKQDHCLFIVSSSKAPTSGCVRFTIKLFLWYHHPYNTSKYVPLY